MHTQDRPVGFFARNPQDTLNDQKEKVLSGAWTCTQIQYYDTMLRSDSVPIPFELPTINTFCSVCKGRQPFAPVGRSSYVDGGGEQTSFFYLAYECCQKCYGEQVCFLVCRDGLKLRLAGRYPIEVLPTPRELPKSVNKYYGDAIIAHHAGQTLAGLFFLRVFIEQFWKTIPAIQELIKQKPRASGDEQAEVYFKTLPSSIQLDFPSLKEVYGKLSEAIHSASADGGLV